MASDAASLSGSGSESEDEVQVESLVAGRQRRANAGNRMATLLATEEPVETPGEEEDELKLLFEENAEEEDAEFASGDDAVSDVEMDSSSDEEDGKDEDEDAGEKELERQAKEERKKKRKALETFGTSKKRKITETATSKPQSTSAAAQSRPKKKSERVSWLPTQEEGPTRASSRKQTMLNKEVVHERMKESETRRKKLLKKMAAAAEKKEAERSRILTQEDRLAEAAEVERKNAKTLNRWQATEKKRAAEQKAKLEALKSRSLKGPVMTTWSGPSKWVDGKLEATGRRVLEVKAKETQIVVRSRPNTANPPAVDTGSTCVPPAITLSSPQILQTSNGSWSLTSAGSPFTFGPRAVQIVAKPAPRDHGISSADKPVGEIATRNLIILDEGAVEALSTKKSLLVKSQRSSIKAHGKMPEKEKCLITGAYARYRDPKTGIPYANLTAFKQLRVKEAAGAFTSGRWSTLLGQYVGSDGDAPAAVPSALKARG